MPKQQADREANNTRPALSNPSKKTLARLTGADCFVLSLEGMMRKNGQQGLIGQTHLRLDSVPDIALLEGAAARLAESHPLLNARIRRHPLTSLVSWRDDPRESRNLPVNLWFEKGVSLPEGRQGTEIRSEDEWVDHVLNQPLELRDGLRNLHLDLILLRNGGSLLSLTWTHLLFDGKGAEFLVDALVNSSSPVTSSVPTSSPPPAKHPLRQLGDLARQSKPAVDRLFQLAKNQYTSLGGPRPRPSRLKFRMLTFGKDETDRIQARVESTVGPIFSMGFYLACALRAHRMAFLVRERDPEHYVVSIPVQVRKKGVGSTPFQNCVTILFFAMDRGSLSSVESAAKCAQQQFEEMTRARLDRSFSAVLELMSLLPAPIYMRFLSLQFGGEITSFFHSFTGEFSAKLGNVFGAQVSNAYHIPSVSAPPGSGLFFGLFNGRLNATFSWREGSATNEEAERVLASLRADLLGVPASPLRPLEAAECVPT